MYIAKHKLAIIALVIATCLWGASAPLSKWALENASPFTLAFFRYAFATLFILPFVIKNLKIRSADFYKIFILSLFCVTLNNIFFYVGLDYAPSINFPIIVSSTPIFLIVGGAFFLREKPKISAIIGTFVSIIGVGLIVLQPILTNETSGSFLGNICFLLSTICFVIYTILLKKSDMQYPFTTLLFWMFLMGAITLFPFYMIELSTGAATGIFAIKPLIGTLYGAIVSTIICYFLYSYGARHTKSDETGLFIYIEPFMTALIAIPLLGEVISFTYLLGAIFVFAGMFIAEAKLHKHHPMHIVRRKHDDQIISGP